jgi:hypothetical protein
MVRRAAKIDKGQQEIVEALRKAGASVTSLAEVGDGCPDLLVGFAGRNYLIEVKGPGATFTPKQKRWHAAWGGVAHVARSANEALYIIGAG